MEHYNSVAGAMTRSLWCEPIYEVDPNSDEVLWEPWVDGFTRAMRLRPDAWEALLDRADEEARASMIFLMALQDINLGQSKFTEDEIDEIDSEAPDLIPNCVAAILTQSRPELSQTAAANLPGSPYAAQKTQGRNDPRACGSGRKYKLWWPKLKGACAPGISCILENRGTQRAMQHPRERTLNATFRWGDGAA